MGSRMVVSGIGNDTYEPNRDITRAEFAAIIVRALGLKPGLGESIFKDVLPHEWYSGYIETAFEYKIITGYNADTFAPSDEITREQAIAVVARAMKITKLAVELDANEVSKILGSFADADKSAVYAKNNIAACVKAGIVSGRSDNMIAPKANITRAEAAAIVRRLLQKSNLI